MIPRKENRERFQSTGVEIAMLAAEDAVSAMTAVAGAVEDTARPHLVQYHVSHQKSGHAKTWKVIYSPSALVTRAKMVTC